MAKVLREFKVRDEAHQYQAGVIEDGTQPLACCTEHVEAGDVIVVWSEQPSFEEVKAFSHAATKKLGAPSKDWDPTPGGEGVFARIAVTLTPKEQGALRRRLGMREK